MSKILQKLELIWSWFKKNYGVIIAICAIFTLGLSFYTFFLRNRSEKMYSAKNFYSSKKPYIKIKSVYFKTFPYQTPDGSKSIALKFFIPIRNEGDTTAYNITIKKKVLKIIRGKYDLKDTSLRSVYTNSQFDLNPRTTIEDTIFIDESPTYMQQFLDGKKPFTLEYKICFYSDKESKSEPFEYGYKTRISFKEGQFQYETLYENMYQKIKPRF